MNLEKILNTSLTDLVEEQPVFSDFFQSFNIHCAGIELSFRAYIEILTDQFWDDNGISKEEMNSLFADFATGILQSESIAQIESLEVLAGVDKSQKPENCNLQLKPGEITCIVGPTGSGKSRLLADIEWLANEDTPTKRKVLINGKSSSDDLVNQFGGKLIAQITQNMNFVLDMDVESFLLLHAQSRFIENAEQVVQEVL